MENHRSFNIDMLKSIGLLCIILAHAGCHNKIIMQLRSFDVPLLVFFQGTYHLTLIRKVKIILNIC